MAKKKKKKKSNGTSSDKKRIGPILTKHKMVKVIFEYILFSYVFSEHVENIMQQRPALVSLLSFIVLGNMIETDNDMAKKMKLINFKKWVDFSLLGLDKHSS